MFSGLQFSSLSEFLQMGDYTFHVWSVYAVFAIFIAVNLVLPLRRRRQFIQDHKRRARRASQVSARRSQSS